ncbi:CpaF family protein [Pseudidiomarina atlantica]|uniref:CpaF family protein n=1 Tax=Pseudidiomarina atlantica TaxID=1517416 RepID=UPI0006912A97|nr:CpaF family protein [Pseudidiomarina atlantica]
MDKAILTAHLKNELQREALKRSFADEACLQDFAQQVLVRFVQAQMEREPNTIELALIGDVIDVCVGFGPLAGLLADESITEIMVNRFDSIFIERAGKLSRSDLRFTDEAALHQVIERIVTPLGRRIDSAQPMVDARLPDGSRVNAVLAPLALQGSCLTIRKFARRGFRFADLVDSGLITTAASDYLIQMVQLRRNILVIGGTGTGKTTFLNILADHIPASQRVITIEDAAELRIEHDNLIGLEARTANAEGRGQITIRELLINALRMRPDRIIIGECRGAEALDMLQAMNTGHEGSFTTLHANSPREALQRLEVMVMLTGLELPLLAVRQQISSAVNVIVQVIRDVSGHRRVAAISELVGLEAMAYQMSPMFELRDNELRATGIQSEWR